MTFYFSSTVEFDKTLSSIDKLRSSSIWECRAPLQNGKLCPRKDKIKVCICIVSK